MSSALPAIALALRLVLSRPQGGHDDAAVYKSPYGFQFEIPAGYGLTASPLSGEESTVLVYPRDPGRVGPYGVTVRICASPDPKSCLLSPQQPTELVAVRPATLAQRPAQEFVYDRRNKPREWTRQWKEFHTILTADATTYSVSVSIPPTDPGTDLWRQYEQIRQTFRLVPPEDRPLLQSLRQGGARPPQRGAPSPYWASPALSGTHIPGSGCHSQPVMPLSSHSAAGELGNCSRRPETEWTASDRSSTLPTRGTAYAFSLRV